MAPVAAKTSKDATVKAKKTTSAPKKPRAHPPYSEMINEAITSLKERTGSSQIAIAKFIEEKQKANLPNNFKKLLLVQLKKLVASGKLVKVKNSFKLPSKSSSTTNATAVSKKQTSAAPNAAAKKAKSAPTNAAAKKPKSASAKKPKSTSTDAAAKKVKPASTNAATKKPKSASTKTVTKNSKPKAKEGVVKSPGKKVLVVAAAKKPKSIKSPVKKAVAKKAKK